MARFLISLWLAGASLSLAAPAFAQADPFRPPPGLGQASGIGAAEPVLVLQSILIAGTHREAIINGRTLSPGQHIDEYQLIALDANSARLVGPQGRLMLQLNPVQIKNRSGAQRIAPSQPADRHP